MTEIPGPSDTANDSSRNSNKLELLVPGDIISFEDVIALHAFEDDIARLVDPEYNKDIWARRTHIREHIRPRGFNGRISDITLEVMEDPYERLLDAPAREWEGTGGKLHQRTSEYSLSHISQTRGFILSAILNSSGRGAIGEIGAELWYLPIPQHLDRAGKIKTVKQKKQSGEITLYHTKNAIDRYYRMDEYYGTTITRVVTKPKYEAKKIVDLNERSKRIAYQVYSDHLARVIFGPYEKKAQDNRRAT